MRRKGPPTAGKRESPAPVGNNAEDQDYIEQHKLGCLFDAMRKAVETASFGAVLTDDEVRTVIQRFLRAYRARAAAFAEQLTSYQSTLDISAPTTQVAVSAGDNGWHVRLDHHSAKAADLHVELLLNACERERLDAAVALYSDHLASFAMTASASDVVDAQGLTRISTDRAPVCVCRDAGSCESAVVNALLQIRQARSGRCTIYQPLL